MIMDVVYNHTCESGVDGPSLSLRGLGNLEYYLHSPHRPAQYFDVTGTGNTVDFRSTRASSWRWTRCATGPERSASTASASTWP